MLPNRLHYANCMFFELPAGVRPPCVAVPHRALFPTMRRSLLCAVPHCVSFPVVRRSLLYALLLLCGVPYCILFSCCGVFLAVRRSPLYAILRRMSSLSVRRSSP